MNVRRHLALMPGLLLALNACSLTPRYERPALAVPAQWEDGSSEGAESPTGDWWVRYGSDELNQLMSEAVTANHDIAAAAARIDQARATAQVARSRLAPSATASVTGTRDRQDHEGVARSTSSDEAALTVSYELDFWGKSSASADAAVARMAAAQYDRDALSLVLQSEVASAYFQALALKDRLAVARANLDSARQLMSLVETRFENGAASGLDVAQQRTALLGIEAGIPALTQSLNETQSALAVLLGRAPQGFSLRSEGLGQLKLPAVDAGQPAELLERRPDIRSVEASLIAANADLGAARAALYPGLTITASTAVTGWLTGGSTTLSSLTGSLMQTLFAGGSLRAEVAYNEAARQELVESYAQTVLTSLQEVQDGLSAIVTSSARADLLEQAADEAREAYRLAGVRYREGSEDLLSLLTSQQSLLSAEDSLAQARLTMFVATTSLFKALGGGWSS